MRCSPRRPIWKSPFIEADRLFSRAAERSRILPMPKHLLEQAYADDPVNILQHPYWSYDFVGTGPFRLKEWINGSHLMLQANDAFVLGRAAWQRSGALRGEARGENDRQREEDEACAH